MVLAQSRPLFKQPVPAGLPPDTAENLRAAAAVVNK